MTTNDATRAPLGEPAAQGLLPGGESVHFGYGAASRWARRWAWASLVSQMLIVVTGAFVRVTASGLGCPTWPECMPGSYTPVTVPETVYHAWVEFGNRLLTFAVALTAVGSLASYLLARRRQHFVTGILSRRSGIFLAASALIGTFAQAVVGGVSVLTGLSPTWVAAHFLLSALILIAQTRFVSAYDEIVHHRLEVASPDERTSLNWLRGKQWLPVTMCITAGLTVAFGTVVTGSGPHAGDVNVTERFPIDPRLATVIHSACAALLVAFTVYAVSRLRNIPQKVRPALVAVMALELGQGLVGYAQYQSGLPPLMVVLHVALAVCVWVGCLRVTWRWRDAAGTFTG